MATLLATPYFGGAALALPVPASSAPATINIASQSTNTGSTRNDGSNTTVKISATVTPAGSAQPAIAGVRFSYQSTVPASPVTVIGTDTTAPYSIEWAPPAAGNYNEIAEAVDSTGTVIATDTQPNVAVADYSAVHITSPTDGGAVGTFGGNIVVSGTRSSDLPAIAVTVQTRDNSNGTLSTAGTAANVVQGTPAAGADQTWSTAVQAPACGNAAADGGCDVVIKAVATGTGINGTSDEVVEASLYSQTLTTFTVTPPSANQPAGSPQKYVVTAQDQNGKPVAGLTVNVTDNSATATETPATGTTGTDGTFSFNGQDSAAETTTYTVTSQVGGAFNPAVDFTRTATLTTYTSVPTTLTLSASPSKSLYAAPNEYTASTTVASPGTPVVDVCIVDQNGNGTPNAATPPANLIATVTRTYTTGTTVTGPTTTTVVPVQDTRTGKSNCYLIPHAGSAGDYGQDTFNAYFENNGTPGFQAGSSDVAAGALTLKWATLTVTGKATQAQTGTTGTVKFVVAGPDGSPFANRKIALSLSGTDATFPTTQPAGTTYTGPGAATCVTDASGVCTVSITDTTAGTDSVTATDSITDATTNQIATGAHDTASVDFRANSIALVTATKSAPYALFPNGAHPDSPGTAGVPIVDTYTLRDTSGAALSNVDVTVTTDHGFFTPAPKTAGSYTSLTFNPAIADGAQAGNLKSLGTTFTGTTNGSGQLTLAIGIAKDTGFDDDGNVLDKLTFTATGGTYVVNNPADTNQAGTDFPYTWTTNGIAPLNGGSLTIVPATSTDMLSGNVQLPNGTNFVLHATDQFGNLVRDCSNITLTTTGNGTVDDTTPCSSYTTGPKQVVNLTAPDGTATTAGDSTTVTATWKAPVSTFKNTAVAPATPVYTVDQTQTSNKTDSFTVTLYKIDKTALQYSFASTPGNTVPVNTAVTTSVTVKDQKGNPVQGLPVQFIRSGPNDAAGNSQTGGSITRATGPDGKAGTSYSSGTPGTATVTVIVTDGSGNELSRGVQNVTFTAGTPNSSKPTISIDRTAMNVGQSAIITIKGVPGDSVQFFQRVQPASTFSLFRTFTFNANGIVTINTFPRTNTSYFARTAAGDSSVISLSVRPAVSLRGSAANRLASFNGVIVPGHGGVKVRIYAVSNGRLVALVATATTDSQGHYTASHQFAGHGRVTFIAQTISDSIALAGQSNRLTLTI